MDAHKLSDPVIVMGMMRSGTTLLAEMVHRGGTPMYAESKFSDPSYNSGIKYERPVAQGINLEILGIKNKDVIPAIHVVDLPLGEWPQGGFEQLYDEVGSSTWGFKDPRTTLTYPLWSQVFPQGPRLYSYRNHKEVVRYYFKRERKHGLRKRIQVARDGLYAWIVFNEQVLKNLESDHAAGRPAVLVNHEELMNESRLVERMSEAVGIPLFDARDPSLRRNALTSAKEERFYNLLSLGYTARIAKLYRGLEAARLQVE